MACRDGAASVPGPAQAYGVEGVVSAGDWCPIGPLQLHTFNYGHTECIWCGPGRLAWQPGEWIPVGDGITEWRAEPRPSQ